MNRSDVHLSMVAFLDGIGLGVLRDAVTDLAFSGSIDENSQVTVTFIPEMIDVSPRTELDHLRAWKEQAMVVLGEWEQVWLAAGQPGDLGGSKAAAVRRFIDDMLAADDGAP